MAAFIATNGMRLLAYIPQIPSPTRSCSPQEASRVTTRAGGLDLRSLVARARAPCGKAVINLS